MKKIVFKGYDCERLKNILDYYETMVLKTEPETSLLDFVRRIKKGWE